MVESLTAVNFLLHTACFLTIAIFTLRYSFTAWHKSPEGRHMFIFSLVLTLVLGASIAAAIFPGPLEFWLTLATVLYIAFLSVLVWRTRLLFEAQARKRLERVAKQTLPLDDTVDDPTH